MSQFIEMFENPLSETQKYPLGILGDNCIINPTKPKGIDDSTLVSFIPMQDVSDNGSQNEFTSRSYSEVKKGFTYCADGDVIFAKITPCMENGKGAELNGLCNAIGMGSTEFHVLRPMDGKTISTWLYHLTKLDIIRKDAAKNMTGTGGQKRVPSSYFENFKIGIPPIEQQKAFADIAQQADKSKFIDFKSQFIEMFGNGKIWSTYRADMLFDLQMGKTPARNNHSYWINSGSPWVSIADMDIDSIYINDTKETISDIAIKDSNIKIVPKGTIIMSFKLTIGRVCIAQRDLYTNEAIMAFIEKGTKDFIEHKPIRFAKRWLFHYLQNKNWLTDSKQAVKGNTLNKQSIGNTYLEVPEYELQEEFAKIAHQADKSKSYAQNALEKLNNTLGYLWQQVA